ncbi:PTS sugar transporter subunit IIA [Lederbergia lenta]|uniref:PTS system glucose-specific transporter subunit IIA n=1 Tax=Lederbergia lenta TaxID=1467 RepID=A0A2X4WAK0_LEDLE|nr:PTS glucose transporter subunit IIA [Lederbergia lenta]MCM3109351.1 PTS glucose transporter subunit IIA [Lederbergia lenta]MEC2324883.1 PTS glucose transporter subunit IIA [Lederbergia lenta]SQI56948.1 PTS system glucose-specific transporter subunit IIA [Lederbergia lenta]
MLKKLFGKKEEVSKTITVVSHLSGQLIELGEVPDPVFSQNMMGDGMAVNPENGKVVAPVDGEIIQVFPTKHAIGIKAKNGAEILLHIGIETVGMKGEGFTTFIKEGDKVNKGDTLVEFDHALVTEKAASTITPIIITNGDDVASITKQPLGHVTAGETVIMEITMK